METARIYMSMITKVSFSSISSLGLGERLCNINSMMNGEHNECSPYHHSSHHWEVPSETTVCLSSPRPTNMDEADADMYTPRE